MPTVYYCPYCEHLWSEHQGSADSGSPFIGCYHRLDRLDKNQSVDKPDYEGPKWCQCQNPRPGL